MNNGPRKRGHSLIGPAAVLAMIVGGCSDTQPSDHPPSDHGLVERAYVVSKDHDELTVIDLRTMAIAGRVATGGLHNHMAELSADRGTVYVQSAGTNETIVVDARSLTIRKRIPVGGHPTHLSLSPDGRLLAVMAEEADAVVFIDTGRDEVVKTLSGFHTPHFLRFTADGRFAYVANLGAHHLTRVALPSLTIDGHLVLEGFAGPPAATPAPAEGGFADAQIDASGILFAAHHATGKVLVHDTRTDRRLPELQVGRGPWVVFAQHPFADLPLRHLVPNLGDRTVSLIDGQARTVTGTLPGDEEAYGVNFSSRAPGRAFLMNRLRQDVAVADTRTGEILARIPVGGNTETASTTADGRYVVAAVSGADSVVIIDAASSTVVRRLSGVGKYPWSVTIPGGQNYCH